MLISSPFYYQLLHAQIPKVQKYGEKKTQAKKSAQNVGENDC